MKLEHVFLASPKVELPLNSNPSKDRVVKIIQKKNVLEIATSEKYLIMTYQQKFRTMTHRSHPHG